MSKCSSVSVVCWEEAVCARELGVELDKDEQVSDWARRPLTERQKAVYFLYMDRLSAKSTWIWVQGEWAEANEEDPAGWVYREVECLCE